MSIPDHIPACSKSDGDDDDTEAPVTLPSAWFQCQACVRCKRGRQHQDNRKVSFPHFPIKPQRSRLARARRHTSPESPFPGPQQRKSSVSKLRGVRRVIPRLHDLPADWGELQSNPNRDPCPEDFYEFLKILGVGSYGKVYLARFRETGKLVAVKVQLTMQRRRAEKELRVLSRANLSPFLVSLHSHFSTLLALYLVMEYVPGGKFSDKLTEPFSLLATAFYSAQMVLALTHLHGEGVLYRDLKPDNVMMTGTRYIKLCDFGSCFPGVRGSKKVKVSTGTPRYWAPEKYCRLPYGLPSDWWSLGIIVYQMLMGAHPFDADTFDNYRDLVLNSQPVFRPKMNADAVSLCQGLLAKDPEERLGGPQESHQVSTHPFYRRFIRWEAVRSLRMRPPPMYACRNVSTPTYRVTNDANSS
ncbi:hypothetical protein ACOMHN_039047 [Nucella lapillus]